MKRTTGQLVQIGSGDEAFKAFVPTPLSPEPALKLTIADQALLEKANRALGKLDGMTSLLPNTALFIYVYIRKEALVSSQIEGTQSSLSDVLSAEAQLLVETEDQREVLNYVRAFEHGLNRLSSLPLSKRLIREMHAELLAGARGEGATPGEFRRSQNWLGGTNPSNALFVPPPVDLLEGALDDFEAFLHDDLRIPLLVRCALAHFQFETIHPFLDGNGRLGRLLIVFYLIERGVLGQPLLYLSAYFERNRDEYIGALQGVRERGDMDNWISFFLRGVATQARSAIDAADALLKVREDFRGRLRQARARGRAAEAAEALVGNPFVSVPQLVQSLDVTRQGAQYVISSLERAGIVESVPGITRPNLYVARAVLDVLQRDD